MMKQPSFTRSRGASHVALSGPAAAVGDKGLLVALVGPLGAGKTVFAKGVAEGLGIDPGRVASDASPLGAWAS